MKVIAFIMDYAAVDRIIDHLKLTFAAEKPQPCSPHGFHEGRRPMSSSRLRSWRPRSGRTMFRDRRFHERRDVYRLLGDFSVVQEEDSAERPPSSHLNVLDSIRVRDYHLFVMGGFDSELFRKESRGARKSKSLSLDQLTPRQKARESPL
jgi:hypothetical protein